MPLAELEWLDLLKDLESDRVERKSSASGTDKIREAICAFANDLPDHRKVGVVFVGVHDDGRCASLSVDDRLLLSLSNLRDDGNIPPIPSMTVSRHTLNGCTVAVVEVSPATAPPVRDQGRTWVRVGPRRAIASAQEEALVSERRRFARGLQEQLRALDDLLTIQITTSTELVPGTERRRSDYPRIALQELLRNAVMHRDYEVSRAPVRWLWFRDRIEIHNPGGPYGQVKRARFGGPAVTDYRNPSLAEAMKVLGYAQRFGVGIATARKELDKNGNPPLEFDVQETSVMARLKRAPGG